MELSPPDHQSATLEQGDTGRPGVAEQMLAGAGLEFVDRGRAPVVNEFPDCALAVRALAAVGPSWPALHAAGEETFVAALTEALRPLHVEFNRVLRATARCSGRVTGAQDCACKVCTRLGQFLLPSWPTATRVSGRWDRR